MSSQSISLYNLLAKKKQFKKTVNFDLKRIKTALNKLGNPEKKLKNVINIIGSDGKYSILNTLKYFIEDDYSKSNVSDKILRILISYTDYIKTFVWKKSIN